MIVNKQYDLNKDIIRYTFSYFPLQLEGGNSKLLWGGDVTCMNEPISIPMRVPKAVKNKTFPTLKRGDNTFQDKAGQHLTPTKELQVSFQIV